MTRQYIDLHTHTIHSDGQYAAAEVLSFAEKEGLALFSFTDHNTADAYRYLPAFRGLFGGQMIPGIEITTMYNGEIVEILGYGFDIPKMWKKVRETMPTFEEKQMLERLINLKAFTELGAVMSKDFTDRIKNDPRSVFDPSRETSRKYFYKEIVSHPENARFFGGEENMAKLTFGAFSRRYVYKPGSSLFVDQSSLYPTFDQTVDIIKSCGGLAFLAHFYIYSKDVQACLDDIAQNHRLDGLECRYKKFTREQADFLENYCRERGLFVSGGSDFHGELVSAGRRVGHTVEDERLDIAKVEDWVKDIRKI